MCRMRSSSDQAGSERSIFDEPGTSTKPCAGTGQGLGDQICRVIHHFRQAGWCLHCITMEIARTVPD